MWYERFYIFKIFLWPFLQKWVRKVPMDSERPVPGPWCTPGKRWRCDSGWRLHLPLHPWLGNVPPRETPSPSAQGLAVKQKGSWLHPANLSKDPISVISASWHKTLNPRAIRIRQRKKPKWETILEGRQLNWTQKNIIDYRYHLWEAKENWLPWIYLCVYICV